MCGIGGIYKPSGLISDQELWEQVRSIQHRGPDGQEIFNGGSLGLCHARLAIQDVGEAGRQPKVRDGYCLAFNGEIYNFLELKKYLISRYQCHFYGTGDTEVLFEGLFHEGLDFVKKLNGDFAIVWYDRKALKLHLIRDRLGIKPLYFRREGEVFRVSSEVRGLFIKAEKPELNPSALNSFYALRYVRGEKTVFSGVQKVAPATIITVGVDLKWDTRTYWTPFEGKTSWSYSKFSQVLEDSVRIRMRSQVDIGILLSGGMDSTLIAKLALTNSDKSLVGLTCELPSSRNSKKDLARAQMFTQSHQMRHFIYRHVKENFEESLKAIEEPLGDSIISPLLGVVEFAKGKVKVLLSGEGADELFAGYGHHYFFNAVWSMPHVLRDMAFMALPLFVRMTAPLLQKLYPARLGFEEVARLRDAISRTNDFASSYHSVVDVFNIEQRRQLLGSQAEPLNQETLDIVAEVVDQSFLKKLIYLEMKSWLPNYNLLKLDKITGWCGMEGRVPYLDHRLVEMIFTAPDEMLLGFMERKTLVRNLCKYHGIPRPGKIPFTYQTGASKVESEGFLQSKREDLVKIYKTWSSTERVL